MSYIKRHEQDDADVGYEEIGCVPWDECCEALGDDDEDVEEKAIV
jgi:hypothetical protein